MSDPTYKFEETFPLQRAKWYRVPRELVPALNPSGWSQIVDKPTTFKPAEHDHDDRYVALYDFEFTKELLEESPSNRVLARLEPGVGKVQHVGLIDFLDAMGESLGLGAILDEDDVPILDEDGEAIYDEGDPFPNPIRPTRFFATVAEMLASQTGEWDHAVTRNWAGSDGNMQSWTLVRYPGVVANAVTLEMDDGEGFARTFSTKGPDSGDNFASVDEVAAAVAASRHTHHQSVAAFSWDVFHALGAKPSVTTTDLSGSEIIGDVSYVSNSHVVIAFGASVSGYAYLN